MQAFQLFSRSPDALSWHPFLSQESLRRRFQSSAIALNKDSSVNLHSTLHPSIVPVRDTRKLSRGVKDERTSSDLALATPFACVGTLCVPNAAQRRLTLWGCDAGTSTGTSIQCEKASECCFACRDSLLARVRPCLCVCVCVCVLCSVCV